MNPLSPYPPMACVALALVATHVIGRIWTKAPAPGRYASIDGLRGYLALFVFIHHATIWYFYLRSGKWELPQSHLYAQFGQGSVALFFMITAFLFFSKLIDARAKPVDWVRLYISRLLRLGPLYAFAMAIMFLLIAVLSDGVMTQPATHIAASMARWLGFTILGAPNINGLVETPLLMAWVTWSLTYEWFFYLSLPLLALAVLTRPPVAVLAASAASIVFLASRGPDFSLLAPFLGGIAAAVLVRVQALQRFARTGWASWICAGSVASAIAVSETAYSPAPLALFSIAFALIASGNTLFGVLGLRVSRTLGEASYSLYLLHGLILFTMFRFVIGLDAARSLSPMLHWLVVLALTPLVTGTSFATYLMIERPAMMTTDRVLAWIRRYYAPWPDVMRQLLDDERRLR